MVGGRAMSPCAPMIMAGLGDGGPDGPTGAQPTATATRGSFNASNAVWPPAECPTAATLRGSATPESAEDGCAEALSVAASEENIVFTSPAGVAATSGCVAW